MNRRRRPAIGVSRHQDPQWQKDSASTKACGLKVPDRLFPYLHRPGRTVAGADNVLFTTLTMNIDHCTSTRRGLGGGRRGGGWAETRCSLSMVGLSVAQLTLGTIVANLGFSEECRFPNRSSGDTCRSRLYR